MTNRANQNWPAETAIEIEPQFHVGEQVVAPGFTDCFGHAVLTTNGLTVTDVRLIECASMPNYYRITARNGVREDGTDVDMIEAAERFFQTA